MIDKIYNENQLLDLNRIPLEVIEIMRVIIEEYKGIQIRLINIK